MNSECFFKKKFDIKKTHAAVHTAGSVLYMKVIFTSIKAMASSWFMQHVGEDGKKMWSQDEPGCGASHMCTPGVSDVYAMVCAIRALKRSVSHFHSADVKNLPVPIENTKLQSQ